ncbi:MAG TPA: papain fold toxin domain-containing protein [Verrucomicrobiae bacterium]|jgi:hypothetical protein|nr:papain fold toxin domain-containing protein [Verrucomicrobiae bacterium]
MPTTTTMNQPSNIESLAYAVTQKYGLEKCFPCVNELKRVFKANGIHGQILKLSTQGGRGFIVMKNPQALLPFHVASDTAISRNGAHFGVQVGDHVFENIHRKGIPRVNWELQFDCDAHIFTVTVFELF